MGDMGPYNDGSEDAFFNDRNEKRLKTRIEQLEADNGAYEGGLLKRDFDNDILRSDNARLEALLTEAATELEDDAIGRVTPRKHYPTEAVRYARDMDLPNRIRAALNPKEST
jgi:hypothetical protein